MATMTEQQIRLAMTACVKHARALLNSAKAVQSIEHKNIAYHLAVLALEEIGKRELLAVRHIASLHDADEPWMTKHSASHVQKLWWSFFGPAFGRQSITPDSLQEMKDLASNIHERRLAGLYVAVTDDGLSIPGEVVSHEHCESIISLAETRVALAESEVPAPERTAEDIALQNWFITSADDPEIKRQIFSRSNLDKLTELKDVREWIKWLKSEHEKIQQQSRALLQQELDRTPESRDLSKDKWRLRIRIISDSHTIRGKALSDWNKNVSWIKLHAVAGKKNQLIVEFTLRDAVPPQGLWFFGWGLSRRFVLALNIATTGLWWWHLADQTSRYYEDIQDLEKNMGVRVERSPQLKVGWGNRVLSSSDLARLNQIFLALPNADEQDQYPAFGYYIGGITFFALCDIHWQSEPTAFYQFYMCFVELTAEKESAASRSLSAKALALFSELIKDPSDNERFLKLSNAIANAQPLEAFQITLTDVLVVKLLCDVYIIREFVPARLAKITEEERAAKDESTLP